MAKNKKRLNCKNLANLIENLPSDLANQFETELANEGISKENYSSVKSNELKILKIYDRYKMQIEQQDAEETQSRHLDRNHYKSYYKK